MAEFKLLYRASENDFSVAKFHKNCDNKSDTLIIAKTEFGRVVGAYTPLKWNSNAANYVNDVDRKTFLFSLSNK